MKNFLYHLNIKRKLSSFQRGSIIILGSVRDFHAVDWYLNIFSTGRSVLFVSDCGASEGIANQMPSSHNYINLIQIDSFLFNSQSGISNIWRNFIKILLLPLNSLYLYLICFYIKPKIIHAHPIYYGFLSLLSSRKFLVTPQGSEILVRAKNNSIYKMFAFLVLSKAHLITVDSRLMQESIKNYFGLQALVVQNGIDTTTILKFKSNYIPLENYFILSFRSLFKNYRIFEILEQRNLFIPELPIYFVYPSFDGEYLEQLKLLLKSNDKLLGKVNKTKLYELMASCLSAVSVPISDSSPKSVYESIFLGAPVIIQNNKYLKDLTLSMSTRVVPVNISNGTEWLPAALKCASHLNKRYNPCALSISKFDSKLVLESYYEKLYGNLK